MFGDFASVAGGVVERLELTFLSEAHIFVQHIRDWKERHMVWFGIAFGRWSELLNGVNRIIEGNEESDCNRCNIRNW